MMVMLSILVEQNIPRYLTTMTRAIRHPFHPKKQGKICFNTLPYPGIPKRNRKLLDPSKRLPPRGIEPRTFAYQISGIIPIIQVQRSTPELKGPVLVHNFPKMLLTCCKSIYKWLTAPFVKLLRLDFASTERYIKVMMYLRTKASCSVPK